MRKKNLIIDRAYHFMAEALIIFLLAIPFLPESDIPYWNYVGVAMAMCILFSIYAIITDTNAWFIASIPFVVLFFYMAGFSLFFSILFAALCTWRFINISHESILKRESTYIILSLILSIILVVWFQDIMLITYFVCIIFVAVIGNVCSHLSVLEPKERHGVLHKFIFYICTTVGFGAVWVIILFKAEMLFRFLSAIFINSILWVMETLSKGIAYFIPEIHGGYRREVQDKADALYEYLVGNKQHSPTGEYIFSWLIVLLICIFIGVIVFFTIRHFQRRLLANKYDETNSALNYKKDDSGIEKKGLLNYLINPFGKSPDHQVRKLIYQFEQQALKADYARHSYETLGNWFHRIDAHINPEVYERIRYGKKEVSKEEVDFLKDNIKAIVDRWDEPKR